MSFIKISDSILKKLICSECDNYLSKIPIFIKQDGDQICYECSEKFTLNGTNSLIRCKIYEDLASTHIFPCKYFKYGCTEQFQFNKFEQHENLCTYRVYLCPESEKSGCAWKGTTTQLYNHYVNEHKERCLNNLELSFGSQKDYNENNLVEIEDLTFLLQVYYLVRVKKVWFNFVYLGKRGEEKSISYDIILSNVYDRSITINCGNPMPANCLKICLDSYVTIDVAPLWEFLNLPGKFHFEFRLKVDKNLNEIKNKIITCPYCKIEMVPPIYRCALKHVTCVECKDYINCCIACDKKNCEFSRAIDLENVTYLNQFTCRWKGCDVQLDCHKIRYHEYECIKREYTCPECNVLIGACYKLPNHFKNNHKDITFKILTYTSTYFTTNTILAYIYVHNELFKVVISPDGFNTQTVFITFCGPPSMVSYFHYEVQNRQNFLYYAAKINKNHYKVTTSNYGDSNVRYESCILIKFTKRKGEDMWIPFETSKKRKCEL